MLTNDPVPARPHAAAPRRFRLHLLTWLALAVVAYVVVLKQLQVNEASTSFVDALGSDTPYHRGWPIAFERGGITRSWVPGDVFTPDEQTARYSVQYCSPGIGSLQTTAVLAIAFICLCLFFEDRSLKSRMQISTRGLLKFIAILAIILALFGKEMLEPLRLGPTGIPAQLER